MLLADLMSIFPPGNPNQMYVTTRDYATKNGAVVTAFRAAIDEAATFIAANPDKTRQDIGKVLKLPPPVIANLILPAVDTKVTKEQLAFWIDVMKQAEHAVARDRPREADLLDLRETTLDARD